MPTITPQHDLREGDILCSTWGYDQTNVDFYRVEEIRGKKKVMLSHLRNKTVANHTTTVEVVPCEESSLVSNKNFAKMVQTKTELYQAPWGHGTRFRHYVKITNYQTAVKWHGQPMHETAWGYGH